MAVFLGGCGLDLAVSPDANLLCNDSNACPEGFSCRTNLGRCVPTDTNDILGPTLAEVQVTPAQATLGTFVDVSFVASEPLGALPNVTLVAGESFFAHPEGSDVAVGRYASRYVVTHQTPQGTQDISARVVDRLGNETLVTLGQVTVDFSPPVVGNMRWNLAPGQSRVRQNDTLVLQGDVELNALLVRAQLNRSSTEAPVDVSSALAWQSPTISSLPWTVTMDTSPLELVDGETLTLELVFADAAANENPAGSVRSSTLSVDLAAPTHVALIYNGANPTQSRDIAVTVSSLGAAQMRFSGDVISHGSWQTVAFPAQIVVTLSDGNGPKSVVAEVRDEALNVTATTPLLLSYLANEDTEGPQVLSATAQDTRVVRVVFDEPVLAAGAEDASNFNISGGLGILAVTQEAGEQSVLVFLDGDMQGQSPYTLSVANVTDSLGQLLDPNPTQIVFAGFGNAPDASAPTLLDPSSNQAIVNTTPTLRWSLREGAKAYRVEVSTVSNFSSLHRSADLGAADSSHTVSPALNDGTFYWRVRTDVAPMTWSATGVLEIVSQRVYVFCQAAETCSDAANDRFGHRTKPFRTISRAVEFAASVGLSEVRIAGGGSAYNEMVIMRSGVGLRGGYDGTTWAQSGASTVLQAPTGSPMALLAANIVDTTLVENLTIRGGRGGFDYAVYIAGSTSALTLRNNTVSMLSASSGSSNTVTLYMTGSGAVDTVSSGPLLRSNTILGASRDSQTYATTESYAVVIANSSPWLDKNHIEGGTIESGGAGASLRYDGTPLLTNNIIEGPSGISLGTHSTGLEILGDYSTGLSAVVTNNTIISGWGDDTYGSQAAVRLAYSDAALINNMLVTRGTGTKSYCIYKPSNTAIKLARAEKNGLVNCTCSFYVSAACVASPQPSHVDAWSTNYTGTTAIFTNAAADDFHLKPAAVTGQQPWARLYGRDARSGTCNGITCGSVTQDFDSTTRTCTNATTCLSIGAFEQNN